MKLTTGTSSARGNWSSLPLCVGRNPCLSPTPPGSAPFESRATRRGPLDGCASATARASCCPARPWNWDPLGIQSRFVPTVSAADGTFVFPDVPVGLYRLRVTFPAFASFEQALTVDGSLARPLIVILAVPGVQEQVSVVAPSIDVPAAATMQTDVTPPLDRHAPERERQRAASVRSSR